MIKLKVVDYFIEYFDVTQQEFCCSLAAYYTFDKTLDIDEVELDDLAYFNILVGTAKGLGLYFERIVKNSSDKIVFYPHVAIVENFVEEEVMELIREKLESILGKNETDVIRKAMKFFDWEYQDDEYELNKLYSK
jgi:hypothetical protein